MKTRTIVNQLVFFAVCAVVAFLVGSDKGQVTLWQSRGVALVAFYIIGNVLWRVKRNVDAVEDEKSQARQAIIEMNERQRRSG